MQMNPATTLIFQASFHMAVSLGPTVRVLLDRTWMQTSDNKCESHEYRTPMYTAVTAPRASRNNKWKRQPRHHRMKWQRMHSCSAFCHGTISAFAEMMLSTRWSGVEGLI